MRNHLYRFACLITLLALAGCNLVGGASSPASPTPASEARNITPQPSANQLLETPTAGRTAGPAASTVSAATLILWLPPEFDPALADSPVESTLAPEGTGSSNSTGGAIGQGAATAARLLDLRLKEFSRQNGGVRIQVRIKAAAGPGSLLESLNAASAAAPLSLPSVVALPRADLETAAIKGLIYPYDGASTAIEQADWFGYARQLAQVQGSTFALPFAGDALVVAYRPRKVAAPPGDWKAIFSLGQPLAFPAGDAQGLFVLSEYMSAGGIVEDAQRRPTIQPQVLSAVLKQLADGEQRGIFPYWLSQYETNGQVWQAYREERVNAMVTWASSYLAALPADTTAVPLPPVDLSQTASTLPAANATPPAKAVDLQPAPNTLTTAWGWAVADPDPEQRALAVKLAEFLAEGNFLAGWTEAAGYLPTRPSALAAWSNQNLKTLLSPVAATAQARPTVDQLASLGPVLKEATLKVLKREADPTQAAQQAAEKLNLPGTK